MITGKDVYESGRAHLEEQGFEGLEWDDFVPGAQGFYLEIAQKLNETHFMPVHKRVNDLMTLLIETQAERDTAQTLVQDYQRLLTLMPDIAVWSSAPVNVANWQQYKEELQKRAQVLLFGEEK